MCYQKLMVYIVTLNSRSGIVHFSCKYKTPGMDRVGLGSRGRDTCLWYACLLVLSTVCYQSAWQTLPPDSKHHVIRCLPNLACSVESGVVGYCCGTNTTRQDAALFQQLMDSIGKLRAPLFPKKWQSLNKHLLFTPPPPKKNNSFYN